MKPVRGSVRASKKGPNSKGKKRSGDGTREQAHLGPRPNNVDLIPTPPKKRNNVKGGPSVPSKIRSQENWKPMTTSSISALQEILELSILPAVVMNEKKTAETQKHLNEIKKSFLAQCTHLRVPVQRQGHLKTLSCQLQEESKKSFIAKKTLQSMERDLMNVVSNLKLIEEKAASLEDRCGKLRGQLEEEEEKAQELLQRSEQGVLGLPAPLPCVDATLQDRMMRMVSNTESESTARQLGKVLKKSAAIQNAQVLLTYANKCTDQLLSPSHSHG